MPILFSNLDLVFMAIMLLFLSAMALVVDTQLQFRDHVFHTDLVLYVMLGILDINLCYQSLTVQRVMLIPQILCGYRRL